MWFVCTQFKCQTVLFDPYIGPYQVLPFQAWVDLVAIAMKGYSAFPKAPVLLEPHHQIIKSYLGHLLWVGTSMQRWSWCILQPQTTGLGKMSKVKEKARLNSIVYQVITQEKKKDNLKLVKCLLLKFQSICSETRLHDLWSYIQSLELLL